MHPILFELPGGFPIRSFGVLLALGFLLGSWILTRLVVGAGHPPPPFASGGYKNCQCNARSTPKGRRNFQTNRHRGLIHWRRDPRPSCQNWGQDGFQAPAAETETCNC